MIALSPGHGGSDPGAIGPTGLTEAEVVYDVARKTGLMLKASGVPNALIRSAGEGLTPAERIQAARGLDADLLVDIHCNAAAMPTAEGFEVYHNTPGTAPALDIHMKMIAWLTGKRNRGCRHADALAQMRGWSQVQILHGCPIPSVLVELEFISNPEHEAMLRRDAARDFYAATLAAAIIDWWRRK